MNFFVKSSNVMSGFWPDRVLEEIRRLAFADVRSFFDEHGNLKPIHELMEEQGACLASFEVVKKNGEAGDGQVDIIHKVKVWDKLKALEMAAKHLGVLVDRVEHGGSITLQVQIAERLSAARKRCAGLLNAGEGPSPTG